MKLYFVRHGQTDYNLAGTYYGWTDCDINQTGISQAEKLRDFFHTVAYDAIYTSDLRRAVHTAEIISANQNIALHTDADLREIYFGEWEKKSAAYIEQHYAEDLAQWQTAWMTSALPGGEHFQTFYERVCRSLERMIRENKGKTVVVVAHGGSISAMLCHLSGAGAGGFWRFSVEQGCYSAVSLSENRITIEKINAPIVSFSV